MSTFSLIGFDERQALIYLTILEIGPSSIWDISQKSGIKRPTCYLILDQLAERGFASKTNDGRRTIYSVSSPQELLAVFDRTKSQFAKNLSQIEALASKSQQKPEIRLYEGIEGIKQVFDMTLALPENSEYFFYSSNIVESELGEYFSGYLEARIKKNIKARGIFPDTEANMNSIPQRDKAELRQSRFLPANKFNPSTDTCIFGQTVGYFAYNEKKPFATVIESASLSYDEKERFELLWEMAKEIK